MGRRPRHLHFYNSFGHWQAGYAAAQRRVAQHGPRVFIATGLFDRGYDGLNAQPDRVQAAGGEVIDTFVTHLDPRRPAATSAIAAIQSTRPDSVYALHVGTPAADFVQAYLDASLGAALPLVGSGF